jgi:hypothetical protein
MRPKIFDLLFKDDRKFILEICKVKVNSIDKWAVITRRNVPDFPSFRSDHFDTREEALSLYKEVVPQTPLISLGEKSPDPPISLDEYKIWIKSNGLADKYLDI